jgi:hypothetical protein
MARIDARLPPLQAAEAPAAAKDGPAPPAASADASTSFVPPPKGTEISLPTAQAAGVVDTEIFGQLLEVRGAEARSDPG